MDADGILTGAAFNLTLTPSGNTIIGNGTGVGFEQLLRGAVTSHYGRAPRINVTNIPYEEYDVIMYLHSVNGTHTLTGTDANGPVNSSIAATFGSFNEYVDASAGAAGNYIVWSGLTGSSFTATMGGNADRKNFVAMQIVQVQDLGPDPELGRVGLNFAGATNNPGGRKALAPSTLAGAPGYEQTNWNNTPGTAQVGTPSSANDTLVNLLNHKGNPTTIDVTFTSPQTWGWDFGSSPTGDQMLNGNGITDGSPTVVFSEIPYDLYDVAVYIGMYAPGRDSTYTLNDGVTTYERYAHAPTWGNFDATGWVEISESAISPATRETGNYMVFKGLTASSFTLTSLNGGGINAIQILQVPEPGTFGLGLSAVLGMMAFTWRRKRGR